jgi:hypothetical protein
MSISRTILVKSFVKPFYRQHAGLFVFLFTVMFGVVSVLDGAKFTDYHFYLIKGMMTNQYFLMLVLLLWLLYVKKTEQFVVTTICRPEYAFLNILATQKRRRLFRQMIWIQFVLILPIILYACIVIVTGCYIHEYINSFIILIYLISVCLICAGWYLFIFYNPGKTVYDVSGKIIFKKVKTPYWSFFVRYTILNKKLLLAGIKIYSCSVLYFMVVRQSRVDCDLRMILLFFSLGILGHGILIHQLRNLEESQMSFYRTLPISLIKRFAQYSLFYFFILLPELFTIIYLTPQYLHVGDAVTFIFLSYAVLLFLNSVLFIKYFRMIDYLKIILCIFFVEYFFVLMNLPLLLSVLFFLCAIYLFVFRYYRFER